MKRHALFALCCACGVMLIAPTSQSSRAADDPAAPKGKAKAAAKADGPKHRLPAHYADLVDDTQKAKIYQLQDEHEPEIQKHAAALKQAKAKRDAAIAAVLTPAQQEKLAKIEADSKGKKKGKADMDDDDAADEKPAATKKTGKGS